MAAIFEARTTRPAGAPILNLSRVLQNSAPLLLSHSASSTGKVPNVLSFYFIFPLSLSLSQSRVEIGARVRPPDTRNDREPLYLARGRQQQQWVCLRAHFFAITVLHTHYYYSYFVYFRAGRSKKTSSRKVQANGGEGDTEGRGELSCGSLFSPNRVQSTARRLFLPFIISLATPVTLGLKIAY